MLFLTKILATLWAAAYSWPSLFSQESEPAMIIDCGPETNANFTLQSAKFIPQIPEANKNIDLYINYDNNYQQLSDITAHYKYTLNGIPMPKISEEICSTSPDQQHSQYLCPMPLGEHYITKTFAVPNIGGKLEVQMEWRSQHSSTTLLCIRALMVFPVWQALRWH